MRPTPTRSPRRPQPPSLSMDSFLDIVTNVVGVMILVALVTVVNSAGITISLGTPLLHDPPEHAARLLFECRAGRVVRIDDDTIQERVGKLIRDHREKSGGSFDLRDVPKLLEEQDVGDEFYRVKGEIIDAGVFYYLTCTYEPRAEVQGEDARQMSQADSDYAQLLATLEPGEHYLFFLVRPDGFEAFRAARRLARARGLETGWHPRPPEIPIRFGPGGGIGDKVQ